MEAFSDGVVAINITVIVPQDAQYKNQTVGQHQAGPPDLLKLHLKLAAHTGTQTVEKLAETRAGNVILHVSRIEVGCAVKKGQAESRPAAAEPGNQFWYGKTFCNLHVDGKKCRKASRLVACANKIQSLIDERERKTRSNLDQWRDVDVVAHPQLTVGEQPMRRVKRLRPVLIPAHHERGKITEEIINGVEVATSVGPHVRGVPQADARVVIDCD